ncbi:unnamed protein product [Symbiodinium sp. CCMP2592]|nr:unnamed protein product [Symbiodinium sp. CCMP2592]
MYKALAEAGLLPARSSGPGLNVVATTSPTPAAESVASTEPTVTVKSAAEATPAPNTAAVPAPNTAVPAPNTTAVPAPNTAVPAPNTAAVPAPNTTAVPAPNTAAVPAPTAAPAPNTAAVPAPAGAPAQTYAMAPPPAPTMVVDYLDRVYGDSHRRESPMSSDGSDARDLVSPRAAQEPLTPMSEATTVPFTPAKPAQQNVDTPAASPGQATAPIDVASVEPTVANAGENPMVSPAAATMINTPSAAPAVADATGNPMDSQAAAVMISTPSVAMANTAVAYAAPDVISPPMPVVAHGNPMFVSPATTVMISTPSVANVANASESPAATAMISTPSVAPAVANAGENPMVSPAATVMISTPSVAPAVANAGENQMVVSPAATAMISTPSVAPAVANAGDNPMVVSPAAAAAMISSPSVAKMANASESPAATAIISNPSVAPAVANAHENPMVPAATAMISTPSVAPAVASAGENPMVSLAAAAISTPSVAPAVANASENPMVVSPAAAAMISNPSVANMANASPAAAVMISAPGPSVADVANASNSPAAAMINTPSVAMGLANAGENPMVSPAAAMINTPSVALAVAHAGENPMAVSPAATAIISTASVAPSVAKAGENPMVVSPAAATMISTPSVAPAVANAAENPMVSSPAAAAMISTPGVAMANTAVVYAATDVISPPMPVVTSAPAMVDPTPKTHFFGHPVTPVASLPAATPQFYNAGPAALATQVASPAPTPMVSVPAATVPIAPAMPPHSQLMMQETQMDVDDSAPAANPGSSSDLQLVQSCLLRANTCDLQPVQPGVAQGPNARALEEHRRKEAEDAAAEEKRRQEETRKKANSGDKTGRQAMVEDFLQANMNWLESSICVNHRAISANVRRGEYKLMSRQDLLVKYHGDQDTVDSIIQEKDDATENGNEENQPKVKTAVQEAKKAMKSAADLILECKSWNTALANSETWDKHRVNVSSDVLKRFWSHWKQHRYPHPAADAFAASGKLYTPIGISGDDAQYTLGGAKIIVMLLSFCLHEPVALEMSRFPWFVLRGEYNLGPKTLDVPLRVLSWSLNVAYGGIFPSLGPFDDELSELRRKKANKPLAGGPFALTEIRGDWKWAYETFRFSRFESFQAIPRLSHAAFITKALGSYVSPLTWVTGFHPEALHFCAMHVVNLGIEQWVNAATLLALLEREFFGAKTVGLAARLQVCTLRFRRWCSLHGIMQSQPFITIGMLHMGTAAKPTTPELTLKAYHGRVFVAFLSVCCEVALQSAGDDAELQLITALTSSLASWHLKVEACGRFLTAEQAAELWRLSERAVLIYRELSARHIAMGSLCWPMKPKLHAYQEINWFMVKSLYNCRFTHCFRDEDCMGLVKHVARRCHRDLLEFRTLCRLQLRFMSMQLR